MVMGAPPLLPPLDAMTNLSNLHPKAAILCHAQGRGMHSGGQLALHLEAIRSSSSFLPLQVGM